MGAEKYCSECQRNADAATHPAAFTPAHGAFNRQQRLAAAATPMSMPVTVMRNQRTLSPSQQRARAEVLAAMAAPRTTTTSVREAEAALSRERTPDQTRRLHAQEEFDMIAKLGLAGRGQSALGSRVDLSPIRQERR
jgi:hypothetical protein